MKLSLRHQSGRSGQAMLIAVLALGGAILGATSIAGLLTLYQIRSTTDSENSAKAIFAADTGVNWALDDYFQSSTAGTMPATLQFSGATINVTCYDVNESSTPCDGSGATPPLTAISEGASLGSRRAFLLQFAGATSTTL
jgi:hypothetical protein